MECCSFCGRKAVYNRRYAGVLLCDRCVIKSVERKVHRTIAKYGLISPGERIAVAVSGGKDSISCLHILADYCERHRCELISITINEGIKGYREKSIAAVKQNTKELEVESIFMSFKKTFGVTLDQIVKLSRKKQQDLEPCTYCGVLRRSLLNRAAREVEADKLATAHSLDDEVQAVLLNYVRGDLERFCRLGPKYPEREGFVPRIKPMREIPEREIGLYSILRGLKAHFGSCPYPRGIHVEIRNFLNELEAKHPGSKFSILRTFDKLKPKLSAFPEFQEFQLKGCKICGEPTSMEICRTCELLRELGNS